jgi:peptidoglycan/xylan/chitin deacetylase (PgdA/CDA1 family)
MCAARAASVRDAPVTTAPRLVLTVDTELSNFPRPLGISSRLDGQDWGVRRMIDVFDSLGVRATFFLDVYGSTAADLAEQQRAAEMVAAAGHDLQLHTHPGPAFDPHRQRLRDYTAVEQEEILDLGRSRISQWTGTRPVLHRAGDWAADPHSLEALGRQGFRADFSASPWSRDCLLPRELVNGNGWRRAAGLLCGVGTCYLDWLTGRVRRVDLGGVSFREATDVLALQIDPLILTLHSFSFLRYNKSRTQLTPFPDYIERLRRYCSVAGERWGYRIGSALEAVTEIEARPGLSLPWSGLPTSRSLSSCAGLIKSVRERLRA